MSDEQIYELECGSGASEPPPQGLYKAKFVGMDFLPATEREGKPYQAAVRLKFEVLDGEHAGKLASNIGPVKPTEKNSSGRLLQGMGLVITPGKKLNLKACVGKTFNVVVSPNQAGRPVVSTVVPA